MIMSTVLKNGGSQFNYSKKEVSYSEKLICIWRRDNYHRAKSLTALIASLELVSPLNNDSRAFKSIYRK